MSEEALNIGGLDVVTVDGLETGRVIYAVPGRRVIPAEGPAYVLEEGSLLCNVATYFALAESEELREMVDRDIVGSVRRSAGRIQSAASRRSRRNMKRQRDAVRSRAGKVF